MIRLPWKRKPVIQNLTGYIEKKYGSGYRLLHEGVLNSFPIRSMDRFQARNHCSLASLTGIFQYYRDRGFTGIPGDEDRVFQDLLTHARSDFYYFPWMGTSPFFIPSLATWAWRTYGYQGKAKSHFRFKKPEALFDTIRKEIDGDRPLIMNFVAGAYRKHTVTCMGYRSYMNGGRKLFFALVADNWSNQVRYVDLQELGPRGFFLFSLTTIKP